jgi:hypothetical protein
VRLLGTAGGKSVGRYYIYLYQTNCQAEANRGLAVESSGSSTVPIRRHQWVRGFQFVVLAVRMGPGSDSVEYWAQAPRERGNEAGMETSDVAGDRLSRYGEDARL